MNKTQSTGDISTLLQSHCQTNDNDFAIKSKYHQSVSSYMLFLHCDVLHCGVFTLWCFYIVVFLHCGVFTLWCFYIVVFLYCFYIF